MVLVSHKHKFIYLKNLKVAGSSCFTLFSKYCHNEDLSEYIAKRFKGRDLRSNHDLETYVKMYKEINNEYGFIVGSLNYLKTLSKKEAEEYRNTLVIDNQFAEHARAITLKYLFSDCFDSYFKFCVVRNPYDRIVSRYNHDIRKDIIKKTMSFREFVIEEDKKGFVNKINDDWYDRCTIHGIPCCDYYIKYDKLNEGIQDVFNILKIDDYYEVPHVNTNKVKILTSHYSNYFDEHTKDIVTRNCKNEIEYFKWKF